MMKKTLLLIALASSSISIASTSNIYDLMYLPEKGTFSGESSFGFTSSKFSLDYLGNSLYETTVKDISLDQTFMYTLSSNTMIGLSEEYQLDSKTEQAYGPGSNQNGTTVKGKGASGFSEPTIFLKQRILEQESQGANLDLQASFSPKMGDAEGSSTTKGGNNLRGGSQFEAQVEVGKKNSETQWKFQANYLLQGNAKSKSASNAADLTQTDSYSIFGGGFTHQWKLAPSFELNLLAGVAFIGEQNLSNANDQTKDVIDSATLFTFGPSFVFNLSEKAMIDFSATYAVADDSVLRETDTTDNSVITIMKNDNTAWHLSVLARYEF